MFICLFDSFLKYEISPSCCHVFDIYIDAFHGLRILVVLGIATFLSVFFLRTILLNSVTCKRGLVRVYAV